MRNEVPQLDNDNELHETHHPGAENEQPLASPETQVAALGEVVKDLEETKAHVADLSARIDRMNADWDRRYATLSEGRGADEAQAYMDAAYDEFQERTSEDDYRAAMENRIFQSDNVELRRAYFLAQNVAAKRAKLETLDKGSDEAKQMIADISEMDGTIADRLGDAENSGSSREVSNFIMDVAVERPGAEVDKEVHAETKVDVKDDSTEAQDVPVEQANADHQPKQAEGVEADRADEPDESKEENEKNAPTEVPHLASKAFEEMYPALAGVRNVLPQGRNVHENGETKQINPLTQEAIAKAQETDTLAAIQEASDKERSLREELNDENTSDERKAEIEQEIKGIRSDVEELLGVSEQQVDAKGKELELYNAEGKDVVTKAPELTDEQKEALRQLDIEIDSRKKQKTTFEGFIADLDAESESDPSAKATNDMKVAAFKQMIRKLDEETAVFEVKRVEITGLGSDTGKERSTAPSLDHLEARRESEASPEDVERAVQYDAAAQKLAELKAKNFLSQDQEAIDAATAEFRALAQERGRKAVENITDEKARQADFAAAQVAMWNDINTRVYELRRQTKYGKVTEWLGQRHPAVRMLIMGSTGIAIGVTAATVGAVAGGVGGVVALTGAATWAAKLAKAKVSVDASRSHANASREKGRFDAVMAKVVGSATERGREFANAKLIGRFNQLTGLELQSKSWEERAAVRFSEREEAVKTRLEAQAVKEGWDMYETESRIAQAQALLEDTKNKERTRHAMLVSTTMLLGGAAVGVAAAELTSGGPGFLSHTAEAKTEADAGRVPDLGAHHNTDIDSAPNPEVAYGTGGEYTPDNIGPVDYADYLNYDHKVSNWAMTTEGSIDTSSIDAANDSLFAIGDNRPDMAAQMAVGGLSENQMNELGLGGLSHQQIEAALHDDALRARTLNMISESLQNGDTHSEIVDNASGNFYNWGAKPVYDADGNLIDTELVQSEVTLTNATLIRFTDADGNISYFKVDCGNFLTKVPTPDVPIEQDTPIVPVGPTTPETPTTPTTPPGPTPPTPPTPPETPEVIAPKEGDFHTNETTGPAPKAEVNTNENNQLTDAVDTSTEHSTDATVEPGDPIESNGGTSMTDPGTAEEATPITQESFEEVVATTPTESSTEAVTPDDPGTEIDNPSGS